MSGTAVRSSPNMEPARAAAAGGPAVLVVVPTLNEAAHIESVLQQLSVDLPVDSAVRFVVCDGGSLDGTKAIVARIAGRDDRVSLLDNPLRRQAAAVNLAVRRYGGEFDILVRCDAHAGYPAGFISLLVQALERSQADAVVVPMDSVGDTCLRKAIAWVSDSRVGSGGALHRGGRRSGYVDHGHHAAFRMAAFVRAGGYDESFSYNEDAEFDCRQRALGARIFLDSDIRVEYVPRGSFGRLWAQYFAYGSGRSRTVRRHPGSLRLRQIAVPAHIAVSLLVLCALFWHPWLAVWPGLYALVLGAVAVSLAAKRRSLCGLLAAPAALVMHAAWAFGFAYGLAVHREARWDDRSVRPLVLDHRKVHGSS
jgi:succinoglycan biosynthesis protein ExoA